MLVLVLVAQSCPTLCDPMDCSPPGSSVHEIFQARILERVGMSFSDSTRYCEVKHTRALSPVNEAHTGQCLADTCANFHTWTCAKTHIHLLWRFVYRGLPLRQVKNLPAMPETWVRSLGWEAPPGEGKGYPLQYSGLENPMDCIGHIGDFPCGSAGKESTCNARDEGSIPGLGRSPWRRERLSTPVFWSGEFHGLYVPWVNRSQRVGHDWATFTWFYFYNFLN